MCLGLGLLERVTGATAARKRQQRAAERNQQNAILSAQANQDQLETNIAQQQAAKKAEDLLSVPVETTSVTVGDPAATGVDPTTGARRTARSRFQVNSASGLAIP